MRQLISALIKYKNTLLYLGLLIISLIFLDHRSFYHQSIFSRTGLALTSKFNMAVQNVSSYLDLAYTNEKLIAENVKLKALELMHFTLLPAVSGLVPALDDGNGRDVAAGGPQGRLHQAPDL